MKNLRNMMLAVLALGFTSVMADEPKMSAKNVLIEASQYNHAIGLPLGTRVVRVKLDGMVEVVETEFVNHNRTNPQIRLVKKLAQLSPGVLAGIKRSVLELQDGELKDIDPSAPHGADFPTVSYRAKLEGGKVLTFANRGGDAHTYSLDQAEAYTLREVLEALTGLSGF